MPASRPRKLGRPYREMEEERRAEANGAGRGNRPEEEGPDHRESRQVRGISDRARGCVPRNPPAPEPDDDDDDVAVESRGAGAATDEPSQPCKEEMRSRGEGGVS